MSYTIRTMGPLEVHVSSVRQVLRVGERQYRLVTVGIPGPSGASGGGAAYRLRQTIPADGSHSFALDPATLEASIQVFVNGLLEDDWTWSAPTLTINFPLVAGDDVEIRYQV